MPARVCARNRNAYKEGYAELLKNRLKMGEKKG
jgi:hypothetical protein